MAIFVVPILFGIYWNKATGKGAIASVIVGIISLLLFTLNPDVYKRQGVDVDEISDLIEMIHDTNGIKYLDYDISFKGICPKCREKVKAVSYTHLDVYKRQFRYCFRLFEK